MDFFCWSKEWKKLMVKYFSFYSGFRITIKKWIERIDLEDTKYYMFQEIYEFFTFYLDKKQYISFEKHKKIKLINHNFILRNMNYIMNIGTVAKDLSSHRYKFKKNISTTKQHTKIPSSWSIYKKYKEDKIVGNPTKVYYSRTNLNVTILSQNTRIESKIYIHIYTSLVTHDKFLKSSSISLPFEQLGQLSFFTPEWR